MTEERKDISNICWKKPRLTLPDGREFDLKKLREAQLPKIRRKQPERMRFKDGSFLTNGQADDEGYTWELGIA